ncbi:Threonylcarbamoyladenosine tRNA methylthiotransferase [Linum perenne]
MAGQLSSFGYALSDDPDKAHLWLINTCTVKAPSQSAMDTLISKGKNAKKPLVVAGCVPQGSRNLKELDGVSIVGVQQIDRVVEVVEETLKGHEVRLLTRKTLPALDLPKTVIAEGVKEIWLSSEDTGAYGRDIGVNLPTLLNGIVAELPPDASTMLRIGMTNPPFILEHLTVVDTLTEKVPGMHIATDIICGFPG